MFLSLLHISLHFFLLHQQSQRMHLTENIEEEEDLLLRDQLQIHSDVNEPENRADAITIETMKDKNKGGHTASVQVRF